jgi:hypothetical protein
MLRAMTFAALPSLKEEASELLHPALVGGVLLAVLVGLSFALTRWHYRRRARHQVRQIRRGIGAYVEKYGRLPIIHDGEDEQPPAELMEVLTGVKMSFGGPASPLIAQLNPECINFVPELMGQKTINGALVDPWDAPYRIALDRNGDGITELSCDDHQTYCTYNPLMVTTSSKSRLTVEVSAACAVWSSGPNRRNECGYGDDVCSWRP